jgi:hypothetical protein
MYNVRSRLWHSSLALVVSLLAFASAVSSIHAEALRAGVAVENITRDDPTSEVHDPLHAKSLVFDDGASQIAIICLDIGGASGTLVSNIRARLNDQLGFDESQVLINASHNHHTQGQVAGDVVERCVKAVRRASETLVPVKIGVGVGREDRIMMNRRLRLEDGRQWTIRRANPSPQDAAVTGLGPVDTEQMKRLIRIRSNLTILRRHLTRGGVADIAAEIQGIRIGEFVLVTFPGELFTEVALRIKRQSPCEHTFVAAYSNGHLGYAPTADAYDSHAYEDCLTPFAPQWQEIYEQKALEIIRRLTTNPKQPPEGR